MLLMFEEFFFSYKITKLILNLYFVFYFRNTTPYTEIDGDTIEEENANYINESTGPNEPT